MTSTKESQQPITIQAMPNGPYLVKGLTNLKNSNGEALPATDVVALCRCGGSSNKPFCDGTHAKNGFSGEKEADGSQDKVDGYVGQEITIHDNRSICAHAGFCTDNLAAVFRLRQEPWIDPNGEEAQAIISAIRQCPSGALSYSIDGITYKGQDREAAITVSKDGPYFVTGGITLPGETLAEGASTEHYTLCRCGASKNKPFCDGSHWSIEFKDDKN